MASQISRNDLGDIRRKVDLYLSVQRFDAAEKLLKATLADHGPMANLLNLLGLTYHKQSRFIEAIGEFNRALAVNPDFIEAALNLTATLCDLSRYEDAKEVFSRLQESISIKQRQPGLVLGRLANRHVDCGIAYEETGMLGDAIQEYRKALLLHERMPRVRLALAKLYVRAGQLDRAKQEFEDLVKDDNTNCEAHVWLGILYYKLGHQELAKRHWETAQQRDPNDAIARAYIKVAIDWPKDST